MDDVWTFDSSVPGVHAAARQIKWALELPDGSRLTDRQHAHLLDSCKTLILARRYAQSRRKRPKDTTLIRLATYLQLFVKWLVSKPILSFADVTPAVVSDYVCYVQGLPGRTSQLLVNDSVSKRIEPIGLLYEYRAMLEDAPSVHPFSGLSSVDVCGKSTTVDPTKPIPEELLSPLITAALAWVEWGGVIITVYHKYLRGISESKLPRQAAQVEALRLALAGARDLPLPKGCPSLIGAKQVYFAFEMLVAACAVIILAFSGVRFSELLSLKEDCLTRRRHGNGLQYDYIRGRTYKTNDEPDGIVEYWIVPDIVVDAVKVLRRSSVLSRERSGMQELFITPHDRHSYEHNIIGQDAMSDRINVLAAIAGVPKYRGEHWVFSARQFRKTFARYVVLSEQGGTVALTTHFKHVAFAMTDRGYIGNDYELREMISAERIAIMADMWRHVFEDPAHLAGKEGKRIQKLLFGGRAGNELSPTHISDALSKLDRPLFGMPYTFCAFEKSTSNCGGDRELHAGILTCLPCPNRITTKAHRPFWEEFLNINVGLLKHRPGKLARAALDRVIEAARSVLRELSEVNDGIDS